MKRTILAGAAALALSGCAMQTIGYSTVPEGGEAIRISAPGLADVIAAGEIDALVPTAVEACARGADWRGLLYVLRSDFAVGDYLVIAPTPEEFSTLCETAAVRAEAL